MSGKRDTQEYDGSLNDFIDRVRTEFGKQFPGVSGDYPWVTDVFNDSVIVRAGDQYYRVTMTVTAESITFAKRLEWETVRLSYVSEMPLAQIRDVMMVSEFKGKYPEVSLAAGVDYDDLVAGDGDPVFVTLPIGKANVKSGNKRFYDDEFLTELEKQVIANKPIGLMGHLKPEDRATEFPQEAVHWVGARRVGDLLWGKGYVPPGEARKRFQRYKASGKKIATSIDALLEGVWDETVSAYRMKADTLRLAQIDIAPADRAGIVDLAAVPHLTAEMNGNGIVSYEEDYMDKFQAIREMTPEDIKLLPEPVRQAVLAGAQPPPEVAQVAAIREALGADDKTDLTKSVIELRQAEQQRAKDAVVTRIRELVEDTEKGVKIVALRGMVTEMIRLRKPQTVQEAETIYAEVIASDTVKTALAGQVQTVMGPPQRTAVAGQQGQTGRYFNIPAEA